MILKYSDPEVEELLNGACDLHEHLSPSLFPRIADIEEAAEMACEVGIKGIVVKNHHQPSSNIASLVNKRISDMKVYGSIVLNYAVGGLNPLAVDAAIKSGVKIVFMPTMDARNHKEIFGEVGQYGTKMRLADGKSKLYEGLEGISILDGDKIKSEVTDILRLAAEADTAIATSHLSKNEIIALVREANKCGVKKIIVTHVCFDTPSLSAEEQIELVKMGAYMEYVYSSIAPPWHSVTIDQMAERIRKVGAEHCILSSDCGFVMGPPPVEGLRVLYRVLTNRGIKKSDIELMAKINPSELLRIPSD